MRKSLFSILFSVMRVEKVVNVTTMFCTQNCVLKTNTYVDVYKDNPCRFTAFHSRPRTLGGIYRPSLLFVLSSPPRRQLFEDKSKVFTGLWTTRVSAQCRLPRTRINPRFRIAVSRNLFPPKRYPQRKKRRRVFPWPRAISFFFIVRTRWAVGIFMAKLFRMSDYVTLRVEHIFRYMIGVIRSYIFSPFNKIFVRIIQTSVLTIESLIRQRSTSHVASLCTFPFSLKVVNFKSIVSGGPTGCSFTESHGAEIAAQRQRKSAEIATNKMRLVLHLQHVHSDDEQPLRNSHRHGRAFPFFSSSALPS